MTKSAENPNSNRQTQQNYINFIKQLDIEDIRLASATMKNLDCHYYPSTAEVKWTMSAKYENSDSKIVVFHRYNVRILEKGKEPKAKLSVISRIVICL
jgi:hypothetical protein